MNNYYRNQQWENEWADTLSRFQFGNGSMPFAWLDHHQVLPNATLAGKVGPAGGYADVLNTYKWQPGVGPMRSSITGPLLVGAVILGLLYYR